MTRNCVDCGPTSVVVLMDTEPDALDGTRIVMFVSTMAWFAIRRPKSMTTGPSSAGVEPLPVILTRTVPVPVTTSISAERGPIWVGTNETVSDSGADVVTESGSTGVHNSKSRVSPPTIEAPRITSGLDPWTVTAVANLSAPNPSATLPMSIVAADAVPPRTWKLPFEISSTVPIPSSCQMRAV